MNRRGLVMPYVLFVLVFVSILGLSFISLNKNQTKMIGQDISKTKAMEYAEAGYNEYLWRLNEDVNYYETKDHEELMGVPIKYGEGYFMLKVDKPDFNDRFINIYSTGWVEGDKANARTIHAKIRKKEFVHHMYVSNSEKIGNQYIVWVTGDKIHGPLHTNDNIKIQGHPIFFDRVTFKGLAFVNSNTGMNKINKGGIFRKGAEKSEELTFPKNNSSLKKWAERDGVVFEGNTSIYLKGDIINVRNDNNVTEYSLRNDIKNGVIYIGNRGKATGEKFDKNTGNVFISGKLSGKLTIGAENNIYITSKDPTKAYKALDNQLGDGLTYINTTFNSVGDVIHVQDKDKKADMLGLVANEDVMILHYGWPVDDSRVYQSNNKIYNGVNLYSGIIPTGDVNSIKVYYTEDYWGIGSIYEFEDENIKKIFDEKNKINLKIGYLKEGNRQYRVNKISYEDVSPKDITIHGAIFGLNGGFGYEKYSEGGFKGNINLYGNITQNIRKPVGIVENNNIATGYNKKYAHDPRMFYNYPPKILSPTNVGWEIHQWKEIKDHVEEK